MQQEKLMADTLVRPRTNNGVNRRQAIGQFDPLPSELMKWLTFRAKPGGVRVHLDACTDGRLGQMIVSSYDAADNHLGDEVIEITTLDYLMTA